MRNVVITGVGIKSCIGNTYQEVLDSLKNGKSGITANETYKEMGFRSQVSGNVDLNFAELIDRKLYRFMGEASAYAYLAAQDAIEMAGISDVHLNSEKTGIVAGSGGSSTRVMVSTADITREKGPKRVGPFMVPRCMSSSVSACIATFFKIKGVNFSITSACSTSAHCIGIGTDQIKYGNQDIVFAGGGEELDWTLSVLFDAMGAMSSKYNNTPELASRPYDVNRDGFVIAGGGGMLVLEELEHAKARGAKIYGEIVGHCANSDGFDMVAPSGEGAIRCMKQALANTDQNVDYINAHGTSTPVGDMQELHAVREVFKDYDYLPKLTSTKSLTGHSLGATGVQEAIYTLVMMNNNFISGSANIENEDPEIGNIEIPRKTLQNIDINLALSNSFGFGGTNACLAISKYN